MDLYEWKQVVLTGMQPYARLLMKIIGGDTITEDYRSYQKMGKNPILQFLKGF